jgi:hypothetical protein
VAFDPTRFGKWSHKALQLDAATVDRSRKVLALYLQPGTEGERLAAAGRLAEIAARAGIEMETLVKAIG